MIKSMIEKAYPPTPTRAVLCSVSVSVCADGNVISGI